jgi:hypothetical protein
VLSAQNVQLEISMIECLTRLTRCISSKLHVLGFTLPRESVIRTILRTAYLATLKTEEGRFVQGSITFCNPLSPDINPPLTRRADYPAFTSFHRPLPLSVDDVVKLSRAVDNWSGSIAVHGTSSTNITICGIIDQLVGSNIRLHREAIAGFTRLGIMTVTMDGVGALSVYHGDLLLCALRQNDLVTHTSDALQSRMVSGHILPPLGPIASQAALVLGDADSFPKLLKDFFDEWVNTVARICIGLRRIGTGGALLITPSPCPAMLNISHRLPYRRMGDAMILKVIDDTYLSRMKNLLYDRSFKGAVPSELVAEVSLAEADAEDRETELTGAVKIVTSLAAIDGLVLLDPLLAVNGFGVNIKSGSSVATVYEGAEFVHKGTHARKIDLSHFGTRHGSMLRYCRADHKAIGIVVSQDGQVRLITSAGQSLVLWENVELLRRSHSVRAYAAMYRRLSQYRDKNLNRTSLGYTDMPKTIQALLAYR